MMGSFVNFNDSYLNHILRNAFHNHDLSVDSNDDDNDDDKPLIEPLSQSSHIKQCSTPATLSTMTNDHHHHPSHHRQYCLVIFKNPKWSTILQRRNHAQVYGEVEHSSMEKIKVKHELFSCSLEKQSRAITVE